MISYRNITRIRIELENVLLLIGELESKGIPKDLIISIIKNEHKKPVKEDERTGKD